MRHIQPVCSRPQPLAPLMIPLLWLAASTLGAAATDPPGRVARVNFLEGSGSMQVAGVDGWTDDLLNRPLTGGDRVWIDESSRAEMHVGSTALRLGSRTAVQILTVDDQHRATVDDGRLTERAHSRSRFRRLLCHRDACGRGIAAGAWRLSAGCRRQQRPRVPRRLDRQCRSQRTLRGSSGAPGAGRRTGRGFRARHRYHDRPRYRQSRSVGGGSG